ncbi:MAG TPA: CapA family protein [Candidatus Paceibacterota bacterium]|nr:CapA family protein [Candidatus Paceibacterota bacterium]
MHKNNKLIFTILILVIIFIAGIFIINKTSNNKTEEETSVVQSVKDTFVPPPTTLYFVGDIMLTRGVESSVEKNFNGDYNQLFKNVGELKNADILFGNLEGDVSTIGNNVGSKYSFRMNPEVLEAIKNAGFDIVSFANNHVGDWNMSAFKDTLSRLNENGILKTGAGLNKSEAEKVTIIEKNGIKFGFLGFTDVGPNWIEAKRDTPGILLASDPAIEDIIKNAKAQSDVLIVSFHFGEEYKTVHNSRQEELAHRAIDNGADIVIGNHPHVIEDVEEYKGKPIVYSLGNFIFDQSFSKDTMRSMLFSVTYENKTLVKTEQRIITLNKMYQPEGIFTKEEIREKDDIASGACPTPKKDYEDMFFANVGQIIDLPDVTYVPSKLREIKTEASTKKGVCLVKEARDAFELMAEAALSDGYTIKASSAYRSYEYQKNLLANAIKSGKEDASISIAKAGHSEHQLGTATDITGKSIGYSSANSSFTNTVEAKWLEKNAYKYGFVMSYPLDKENITGYKYEPWHYRYVGVDVAKKIRDRKITITEYLK